MIIQMCTCNAHMSRASSIAEALTLATTNRISLRTRSRSVKSRSCMPERKESEHEQEHVLQTSSHHLGPSLASCLCRADLTCWLRRAGSHWRSPRLGCRAVQALAHTVAPERSLHPDSCQCQLPVIWLAEAGPACCMAWGPGPGPGQVLAHLAASEGGLDPRGCTAGAVVWCLGCWGTRLSGHGLEVLCRGRGSLGSSGRHALAHTAAPAAAAGSEQGSGIIWSALHGCTMERQLSLCAALGSRGTRGWTAPCTCSRVALQAFAALLANWLQAEDGAVS